jgi:VWFA-related protein
MSLTKWGLPLAAVVVAVSVTLDGRSPSPPSAQGASSQVPFRGGTNTVPVYVTVRDPERGFLTNLTRDDFEIRDEGKLQTITQFAIDTQPLSIVVLIDGSGSMMTEFSRALEGATSLVLRLLPADRARVGSFADRVQFGPRFTSDRDELVAYLKDEFNLRIGNETHLWEAIDESAKLLSEEHGKRVVLVMSDGYNFVLPPGFKQANTPPKPGGPPPIGAGPGGSPIGLGGRNPTGGSAPPPGTQPGMDPGDPERNGVSIEDVRSRVLSTDTLIFAVSMWVRDGKNEMRPNQDLPKLAVETGGAFYVVRPFDDTFAPFAQIIDQLRKQYVLGFTPAKLDGKRHSIAVKVKRPNVDVRARRSYIAAAGAPARAANPQ